MAASTPFPYPGERSTWGPRNTFGEICLSIIQADSITQLAKAHGEYKAEQEPAAWKSEKYAILQIFEQPVRLKWNTQPPYTCLFVY